MRIQGPAVQVIVDIVANGMLVHTSSQLAACVKGELDDGT